MNDELEIREMVDGEAINGDSGEFSSGNGRRRREAQIGEEPVEKEIARKKAEETAKVAALSKNKRRPDPYIWGIYIMLLMISVVELFSASSTEVTDSNVYQPLIRHGIFLFIGFGIVLWLQKTPYTLFNKFAPVFALLSIGLLIATFAFGVNINGAQRALRFCGITIQPPEIAKLAVVCVLSSILGKNQTPGGVTNRGIVASAIVVIIFSILLWSNGLTNTLLLMCVSICMMIIGGIQMKKFMLVMAVYAVAGGALIAIKYIAPSSNEFDEVKAKQELIAQSGGGVTMASSESKDRTSTHKNRIARHFEGVHPDDSITDYNRQVMLANFALANGGLFGQGPGNSRESARLPLAFSDYIYSIIVEDTGFVGGAFVLLLFLLLLARAGRIAYKCSRAFPAFLILGCAVMIVFQALVHMAIVTGVFPVSGQPLPFISKGGTSVLVMSAALGIMLSVARFAAHTDNKQQIKAEKNALPEDMQAANFSQN